jgi:hypothetical protein
MKVFLELVGPFLWKKNSAMGKQLRRGRDGRKKEAHLAVVGCLPTSARAAADRRASESGKVALSCVVIAFLLASAAVPSWGCAEPDPDHRSGAGEGEGREEWGAHVGVRVIGGGAVVGGARRPTPTRRRDGKQRGAHQTPHHQRPSGGVASTCESLSPTSELDEQPQGVVRSKRGARGEDTGGVG